MCFPYEWLSVSVGHQSKYKPHINTHDFRSNLINKELAIDLERDGEKRGERAEEMHC